MLVFHIITAVLGVVGSYLWGVPFLTNKPSGRSSRIGTWITLLGLFGVVVSGIGLFMRDPEVFLGSGKFLSNMTILAFLIVIEGSSFLSQPERVRTAGRVFSMYSWTWIFLAALIHPSYEYLQFIGAYGAGLLLLSVYVKLRKDLPNGRIG